MTAMLIIPMPKSAGRFSHTASATPSSAPCAKVSEKKAMRRHKTKQPKGADNNAINTPAIQAGAIIGSQSLMRYLDVYDRSQDAHDPDGDRSGCVDVYKVLDSQKAAQIQARSQFDLVRLDSRYAYLSR